MFLPISWAIEHIFWFPGLFPASVTTDTWFERHRKNSCFSRLLPPFPWARTHNFHEFSHLMGYTAHFLVPGTISSYRNHRYLVCDASQKLIFLMFSAFISWARADSFPHFMGYTAHFLVPRTIFSYRNDRYLVWEASQKLVVFMFSASISMGYR